MYIRKLATVLMVCVLLCGCAPSALAAEDGSTWDQVKAAGSKLWDKTKEKAPEVWDKTKDKASELYGKAKEKAPEIKEKVKTGVNNAQEKISDFNQDQKDQFFEWFDSQTGGTANTAPSTDDHHNPNGNPEYEPGPDQEPEYEPGPDDGTETQPNHDKTADSESKSDSSQLPQEVLDRYNPDGVYYYDPAGQDFKPVNGEFPEMLVINDRIYHYVPGAEAKDVPEGSEDEIAVNGRVYRCYQGAEPAEEPTDDCREKFWLALACIFGGGLFISLGWVFTEWTLRKRRNRV